MPLPNLIIAGAQKSGTTWLHQSLDKSAAIHGSRQKELNFFNKRNFDQPDRVEAYVANFPEQAGVRYYMESTPHYFRIPRGEVDTARNLTELLDDPKIIVILREPVRRYQSAYIHHMTRGRRDYTPTINEISDDYGMITLGRYASSLEHWRQYFPDLRVVLHDDLVDDPEALIDGIMQYLGLENDIDPRSLRFRVNDKRVKVRKKGMDWPTMPVLSPSAEHELAALYRPDIERLAAMIDRDLSAWLDRQPA